MLVAVFERRLAAEDRLAFAGREGFVLANLGDELGVSSWV